MKLSISTLGCPGRSLEETAALLGSCGVEGMEIRGIGGELEATKMPCLAPENLVHTHEVLAEYRLTPLCLGSSVAMHRKGDNIALALADAEVCARADIPAIRIFGNNLPTDAEARAAKLTSIANDIARLCRLASPLGVNIWLETHGDVNTVETLGEVIRACEGLLNFGVIWDVAHTFTSQCRDFEPVIDAIYPYVRHVHIKDRVTMPDGREQLCLPGRGELPLRDIVRALDARGYDGYYSLEWEKLWHPELEEPEVAFPYFVEFMRGIYA